MGHRGLCVHCGSNWSESLGASSWPGMVGQITCVTHICVLLANPVLFHESREWAEAAGAVSAGALCVCDLCVGA